MTVAVVFFDLFVFVNTNIDREEKERELIGMPVRERVKIFRAAIGTLEQEVNNFLASSEEIDDLVDVKIMETGNNTAVVLVVYRKMEDGVFSFG